MYNLVGRHQVLGQNSASIFNSTSTPKTTAYLSMIHKYTTWLQSHS